MHRLPNFSLALFFRFCVVVLSLLCAACATSLKPPTSNRLLQLILHDVIEIAAFHQSVAIQDGVRKEISAIDTQRPFCELVMDPVSHRVRRIQPGAFRIGYVTAVNEVTNIYPLLASIVSVPESFAHTTQITTFFLLSGEYGDSISLVCRQIYFETVPKNVLLDRIQVSIYPIIAFKWFPAENTIPI